MILLLLKGTPCTHGTAPVDRNCLAGVDWFTEPLHVSQVDRHFRPREMGGGGGGLAAKMRQEKSMLYDEVRRRNPTKN